MVDRKDLDYQTMREYDNFQKDAANSNTNVAILERQLNDPTCRIIITTIQKLSILVKRSKDMDVYNQHVVMIFDECHRSQFGEMHTAITKKFKKYYIFGFTGTPIFFANANATGKANLMTTYQVFGERLHTYTIINAISDQNVLSFHLEYIRTMREKDGVEDAAVEDIDRERIMRDPKYISNIVTYIIKNFGKKTKRNSTYQMKDQRLHGFNSIFATASIDETSSYTYRQSEPEKDPKVNSDAGNPFKSMSDLEIELKIIKGEYITFLENNVLIADGQPASFLTNDKSEIYELREKIIMLSKALGKNDLSWCDNLMKEKLEKNSSKTKARQKKGFINRLFGRSLWK